MRLGIMQPYFFPYLGYYSLIRHTDQWVVFDPVQFIRHGWIERNRILKPVEGWQYIGVPLQKSSRDTEIRDMRIRNTEDWKGKMFRQLDHYRKAPHYKETIALIGDALDTDTDSIVELDARILKVTCDYLSIPFEVRIFSGMGLQIEPVNDAGEWALQISKAMGATEYVNPPGGRELFDPEKFREAGIGLSFLSHKLPPYSQRRPVFENGLSIIDVLMFNNKEQTLALIDDFELDPGTATPPSPTHHS